MSCPGVIVRQACLSRRSPRPQSGYPPIWRCIGPSLPGVVGTSFEVFRSGSWDSNVKLGSYARGHRPSGLPLATVSQASVRVSPYLEVYRHSRKRCHHRSSSGIIRRERSPNFLMTTTNKLNKLVTPVVIVRQASPIATVSRPQSGSPPYLEVFGTIN